MNPTDTLPPPERAWLVSLLLPREDRWAAEESRAELCRLCATAGATVAGQTVVRRPSPSPSHLIGLGKVAELATECRAHGATLVVFDHDLTPVQGRNLERGLDLRVVDRTELILDIFAQHARTREGMLQIELAQLEYMLPRLTRMWTHLSRQQGGIGMRGPGEAQLEVDRRRIQERILRLHRELELVRKNRGVQRSARRRRNWPVVCLVGYTNAGKSTLLNALTGASVRVEDALFATLDPTTRSLALPGYEQVLLTDTVGFLRRLPHGLIEAFKATLEEVAEADLLVHVVDASHPEMESQMKAVREVLAEIGAAQTPVLHAFNKIDRVTDSATMEALAQLLPDAVLLSAKTGAGLDGLKERIERMLGGARVACTLRVPPWRADLVAKIHRTGMVVRKEFAGADVVMEVRVAPEMMPEIKPFLV